MFIVGLYSQLKHRGIFFCDTEVGTLPKGSLSAESGPKAQFLTPLLN